MLETCQLSCSLQSRLPRLLSAREVADVPSHAVPNEHSLVDVQRVQNSNHIFSERLNTLLDKCVRRSTSPCVVKRNAAESIRDQALSYWLIVILRRAQSVHEDECFACLAILWFQVGVVKAFVADVEERHVGWNVAVFVSSFHNSLRWVTGLVPIGSGTMRIVLMTSLGYSKHKNTELRRICTNLRFSNPKAMIYYRCSISECMIATAFTTSNQTMKRHLLSTVPRPICNNLHLIPLMHRLLALLSQSRDCWLLVFCQ